MEELLSIESGERLTKADMSIGNRPFIGASDSNNGVTCFVDNLNASLDSNVLGVNYNGSMCYAFYHPYEALFSDDVKRVRWKEAKANNPYTLLYLSVAIAQQRDKYAYGYKFNSLRMKRQLLLLPTTPDGAPDWAFMAAYMRQQERAILSEVLSKLEARLAQLPTFPADGL